MRNKRLLGIPKTYIMKFFKISTLVLLTLFICFTSCQNEENQSSERTNQSPTKDIKLFELKDKAETGVDFENVVVEDKNIIF